VGHLRQPAAHLGLPLLVGETVEWNVTYWIINSETVAPVLDVPLVDPLKLIKS